MPRKGSINRDKTDGCHLPAGNLVQPAWQYDTLSSQEMPTLAPVLQGRHGEGFYFARIKGDRGVCRPRVDSARCRGAAARVPRAAPPRRRAAAAGGAASSIELATATSAAPAAHDALVARPREGHLNVITLPSNWPTTATSEGLHGQSASRITDANPEGSSQNELTRSSSSRARAAAPDVVDVAARFAITASRTVTGRPYEVATWNDHPGRGQEPRPVLRRLRRLRGHRVRHHQVKTPPTTFNRCHGLQNQVASDGNPTQTGVRVRRRLSGGPGQRGSAANIAPGSATSRASRRPATPCRSRAPRPVQSGQTPSLVWWTTCLASESSPCRQEFQSRHPVGRVYAGYYDQAITRPRLTRPAARLWEEYLYSTTARTLPPGLDPPDRAGRDDRGRHDRPKTAAAACPPCRARHRPVLADRAQQPRRVASSPSSGRPLRLT